MVFRLDRLRFCFALLLCISVSGAGAHVTQTCLLLVKQSAQALKHCVEKKETEQCSDLRHLLSEQITLCREESFSDADIQHALLEGEKLVPGKARYVLNTIGRATSAVSSYLLRGNLENFAKQFSYVKAFPSDDLNWGMNEGGCHKAYMAEHDRYQYAGQFAAKRYDLDDVDAFEKYQIHYFIPMKAGICYPIPKAEQSLSEGELLVTNLPKDFFRYLSRGLEIAGVKAIIDLCDSTSECSERRQSKQSELLEYEKAYRALKRLLVCEDYSSSVSSMRRSARLLKPRNELPEYCDDEAIPLKIEQGRAYLSQLAKKLFDR